MIEKRKQIKKEIYKKIYEQFSRKIKKAVEFGNKQIFLTIPTFLVGYPVFDRSAAAHYVARQFKHGGFNVNVVGEYEIYVNWIVDKKKDSRNTEHTDETQFPDLMKP